jgi:hypothetical protein
MEKIVRPISPAHGILAFFKHKQALTVFAAD